VAQSPTRDEAFLSAVTIGEIRKGLVVLPQGRRRTELEAWFHADLLIARVTFSTGEANCEG
jgi:hypothetical protein